MKIDKKLFKQICEVQTVSYLTDDMQDFVCNWLHVNKLPYDEDEKGNIYVNRHLKNVPCIVAHMDTVHDIVSNLTVFQSGDIWTGINIEDMTQTGIGGDDKCGIYIALEMLRTHNIKAAFFVDEEVGCIGSFNADMTFFKDCLYVLQCDRRGNNDFVTNILGEISSKKFQTDIKPILAKYCYKFSNGMITDVGQLAENKIGISTANISCGYYNPHQDNEYINLADMLNCMELVNSIFTSLADYYPHKFKDTWKAKIYSKPAAKWNSIYWDKYDEDLQARKDEFNKTGGWQPF